MWHNEEPDGLFFTTTGLRVVKDYESLVTWQATGWT
jgi:hypothetical protein